MKSSHPIMCGDMHEIPDRRHRVHQQHHGPRPPSAPRPEALTPPRQRQDPDEQGRDERHFILQLRQRIPGDRGDRRIELPHPQGREPYRCQDIGRQKSGEKKEAKKEGFRAHKVLSSSRTSVPSANFPTTVTANGPVLSVTSTVTFPPTLGLSAAVPITAPSASRTVTFR